MDTLQKLIDEFKRAVIREHQANTLAQNSDNDHAMELADTARLRMHEAEKKLMEAYEKV